MKPFIFQFKCIPLRGEIFKVQIYSHALLNVVMVFVFSSSYVIKYLFQNNHHKAVVKTVLLYLGYSILFLLGFFSLFFEK